MTRRSGGSRPGLAMRCPTSSLVQTPTSETYQHQALFDVFFTRAMMFIYTQLYRTRLASVRGGVVWVLGSLVHWDHNVIAFHCVPRREL